MPLDTRVQVPTGTPPVGGTLDDDKWQRWFQTLYDTVLDSGLKSDKLTIVGKNNNAVADNSMLDKQLLRWFNGHYVDYTTESGDIAYGYACVVRRQSGGPFAYTVGAQIDAIADRGAKGICFGIAVESIGLYRFQAGLIGGELTAASFDDANLNAKWGSVTIFKNRFDGVPTVPRGLGVDQYNWFSIAHAITAQWRSGAGEHCGWTRGWAPLGDCFDSQVAPAWSATKTYQEGMVVSSGGRAWQCALTHINQVPAVPSIYWDLNTTPALGVTANAIGIDFVSLGANARAQMSSAIRLRDFMRMHWDVTGAIGTFFDSALGNHVLTENAGVNVFFVGVGGANGGLINTIQPQQPVGGGAAAVLGTIGGVPGPAGAAQTGWFPIVMNGVVHWLPTWT